MNIAIRILVIILLFLTIGALLLEVKLFGQREELKDRNLLLTKGLVRFAKTIEDAGTNSDLLAKDFKPVEIPEDQLKNYYQVGPDGKPLVDPAGKKVANGPGTMDATLNDVLGKATLQLTRLNDTRSAYEQEIAMLTATSAALQTTEKALADEKETVKTRDLTIKEQADNLEKQKEEVAKLGEEKEKLETKVDTQQNEITKLSDKVADRESQIDATKKYVEKLEGIIARTRGSEGASNNVPPGLQGQIILVNPEWNFVILGILPESQLVARTELMVQRDDKLVGKVLVSEVQQKHCFAVAEIMPDWIQMPVEKGDYVFY